MLSASSQLPIATDMLEVALSSTRSHCLVGSMAELSKENTACLFGDILPAVGQQMGGLRPPATPQMSRRTSDNPQGPPAKFQKQDKPKGGGKGRGKDKKKREVSAPSSANQLDSQLILQMAQLCLRHEDSINILRMDKAYVMMFRTKGEETMLATLKDLEVRWQELRDSGKTECAKRIALLKGVLLELQTRAKAMLEKEDKIQLLIKLGWMTKQEGREPMWQPLVWNVQMQKDIPFPDLGPLPHSQAMKCLETVLEHANSQVVQRFHSTRPLAREYSGDIMDFLLEISLQGPAPLQVHDALNQLCNSALWFLIGARLRTESLKRSSAANKLQQILHNGSFPWFCATLVTYVIKMPLSCPGFGPYSAPMLRPMTTSMETD